MRLDELTPTGIPGLYEDGTRGLHVVVPELLDSWGFADTDENRETVCQVIRELVAESYPGTSLLVLEDRPSPT